LFGLQPPQNKEYSLGKQKLLTILLHLYFRKNTSWCCR